MTRLQKRLTAICEKKTKHYNKQYSVNQRTFEQRDDLKL